jgi:NDP-sugar pyrophosphorylase family protein
MDLIVFSNDITSFPDAQNKNIKELIAKIEFEHIFNRIIRIAIENKVQTVHYITDRTEVLLNYYISTHDPGIDLNIIMQTKPCPLYELFALSPSLKSGPFCVISLNSIFSTDEFSMFINYSLSKEDIEGVISITRLKDEETPLCVALNEEDKIIKFSNKTEGYNWTAKNIYFFYPNFFDEMEEAIKTGISDLPHYLHLLISKGYQINGFSFSSILEIKDLSLPQNLGFLNNSDKAHF